MSKSQQGHPRRLRRCWALLSVLAAAVMASCGGAAPADPTDALVDAVDRTLSGSFAFDAHVEIDDAARGRIPSGEVPFTALLESLEISGQVSGDGALRLAVTTLGQQLFELRQTDAAHVYLRTDAPAIAEAFDLPIDRQTLLADAKGAPQALIDMWDGLLDGRWVAIVGEPPDPPPGLTMDGAGRSEMQDVQRAAFGETPADFTRRFATATPVSSETRAVRALAVELHVRSIAEAMLVAISDVLGEDAIGDAKRAHRDLVRIPETAGGMTVELSDRLIDRITVDLFEVLRPVDHTDDQPTGSLRLVTRITQHGTAGPVTAPDDVLEVAAQELGSYHPAGALPLPVIGQPLMWSLATALSSPGMTSRVDSSTEMVVEGGSSASLTSSEAATPDVLAPPLHIDVSPHTGPAGSRATITVEGFAQGPVEIRWDDSDGPVLAAAEGPDFTTRVTVPAGAKAGQHTFVLRPLAPDAARRAAISFEVTR